MVTQLSVCGISINCIGQPGVQNKVPVENTVKMVNLGIEKVNSESPYLKTVAYLSYSNLREIVSERNFLLHLLKTPLGLHLG